MKLTEALLILKNRPEGVPFEVLLACGSSALHLETFLAAHLQQRLARRHVSVRTGLYGDLGGTLEAISTQSLHGIAVVVEWADLDPRLGHRQMGGWGPKQEADIGFTVRASLERIRAAVGRLDKCPIGVMLPSIPLAPIFHTAGWEAGEAQWAIEAELAVFARDLSRVANVRIAPRKPVGADGHDVRSELRAGFPYSVQLASRMGQALSLLIHAPEPKKGLITDLDDTFWHGLVGEVGPEGVNWDLAGHHPIHGLYQQLLGGLIDTGVLVGVASKNDPVVVEQALRRSDLVLPGERMFPVEAHWNAKSGSVRKILNVWNISADAVVFIDDSPIELAEVEAAHPGITCLEFPRDVDQALELFRRVRDLFGKHQVGEEDSYRLESIRRSAEFSQASADHPGAEPEALLESLNAELTIDINPSVTDARVLELVNKTNQFNLNGVRYTETDWRQALEQPGAFLAVVSYQDKFGPLGKIAVIQGRVENGELRVETWVMSCRAFARRIEHQCLAVLMEQTGLQTTVLLYEPTSKNGPVKTFLTEIGGGTEPATRIEAAGLRGRLPRLFHDVRVR